MYAMKRYALWFVAIGLFGCSVPAQTPTKDPTPDALQSCLLGTDVGRWGALKLSTDQLERVRRIQEACKEECSAAAHKKQTQNTISTADGSTVLAELKNILTADQYRNWVSGCVERAAGEVPAK